MDRAEVEFPVDQRSIIRAGDRDAEGAGGPKRIGWGQGIAKVVDRDAIPGLVDEGGCGALSRGQGLARMAVGHKGIGTVAAHQQRAVGVAQNDVVIAGHLHGGLAGEANFEDPQLGSGSVDIHVIGQHPLAGLPDQHSVLLDRHVVGHHGGDVVAACEGEGHGGRGDQQPIGGFVGERHLRLLASCQGLTQGAVGQEVEGAKGANPQGAVAVGEAGSIRVAILVHDNPGAGGSRVANP